MRLLSYAAIILAATSVSGAAIAQTMETSCYAQRKGIAAHRDLPFGTILRIEYPETGRSAHVTIHDRGPFIAGRELDIACSLASELGFRKRGVAPLETTVVYMPQRRSSW